MATAMGVTENLVQLDQDKNISGAKPSLPQTNKAFGHDSIASFRVDPATGKLTATGHTPTGGQTPRNFNLDPTGGWLIAGNQKSGNVAIFKVNAQSGMPEPTGQSLKIDAPVCIRFLPVE